MRLRALRALAPSPRLQVGVGPVFGAIATGTIGFMLIAGYSFVDALYQSVTTLSTVGFRETQARCNSPLTDS